MMQPRNLESLQYCKMLGGFLRYLGTAIKRIVFVIVESACIIDNLPAEITDA